MDKRIKISIAGISILDLQEQVDRVLFWQDVKLASAYVNAISQFLKGKKEYPKEYLRILARLKWLILSNLSASEFLEIFDKYIDIGLEEDIDILYETKLKLISLPFQEDEMLREKISGILENNSAEITKHSITVADDPNTRPSVKNWLLDYREKVARKPDDKRTLARAEYFNLDKNFLFLDEAEKQKLKKLFSLYDFLNTVSVLPEGYAEDVFIAWPDGEVSLLDDGKIKTVYVPPEETPKAIPPQPQTKPQKPDSRHEVLEAYRGKNVLDQKIFDEMKKIESEFGGDYLGARKEFFSAVQKINIARSSALLFYLAQAGDLPKFLKEDEKLKKFLQMVWEKKYGKTAANEFTLKPEAPKFMKLFLRYVLTERLGISENESARFGMKMGNILKKSGRPEYGGMAYYDMEKKEFLWME